MPQLPLPATALAHQLSRPLGGRPRETGLTVTEVGLLDLADQGYRLVLTVRCVTGERTERWQVAIPAAAEDLDGSMTRSTFVATFRANLEEWWDTRSYDPNTRSWGRRLDRPAT